MQCATHPTVETELACSRCGKAICPRCMVYTPVGGRCRECANVRRIPTYNIGAETFIRAAGSAIVSGTAIGVAWWWFSPYPLLYVFYGVLAGLAIGYAIGESVSLGINRKVGPPLQAIAVTGVLLAWSLRSVLLLGDGYSSRFVFDLQSSVSLFFACFIAIGRLR
jgi:hypothetical protein